MVARGIAGRLDVSSDGRSRGNYRGGAPRNVEAELMILFKEKPKSGGTRLGFSLGRLMYIARNFEAFLPILPQLAPSKFE
jgi:hypothetical protein